MRRASTWALVADGVRARILRELEAGTDTSAPVSELVSRSRSQHLRDIMSDKPGGTRLPDRGGRRSAMDYSADPIRRDMQDFAREIIEHLDMHRRAGDFQSLAIFAAPHMLGILRQSTPPALGRTVILEDARNLVPLGEAELREVVREAIRSAPDGLRA